MKERPYQKLIAWKEAHSLCIWIYAITKQFPGDEKFRLVDQMCRAASSVPMNIAEGSGKSSNKERARYYETALCSLEEVHYQCVLARDLQYMAGKQFDDADDRIQRVSFLARKLRSACF